MPTWRSIVQKSGHYIKKKGCQHTEQIKGDLYSKHRSRVTSLKTHFHNGLASRLLLSCTMVDSKISPLHTAILFLFNILMKLDKPVMTYMMDW